MRSVERVRKFKPFLRWKKGWPILTCAYCNQEMGWLGGCYWLCGKCHQIFVSSFSVSILRSESSI